MDIGPGMTNLGQRVKSLRSNHGLSQKALGDKVGLSQPSIERIESGKTLNPGKIVELAKELGVSADYLRFGEDAGMHPASPPETLAPLAPAPSTGIRMANHLGFSESRDLPVIGKAAGGDGALVIDAAPIDWTFRPADLRGVQDAFAVYVTGDSMVPKYLDGDLLYVHPGRPIRKGRHILLETSDHHGLVKRFEGWEEDHIVLTQYNPALTFRIQRSKILRTMLIIGSIEN